MEIQLGYFPVIGKVICSLIRSLMTPAKFSATVNMVLANGSSPHKHKISDFSLNTVSTRDNATTYEGTLSISMMDGPVFGIPYLIKDFQNDTVSISLEGITSDQLNVVNHWWNTNNRKIRKLMVLLTRSLIFLISPFWRKIFFMNSCKYVYCA